MIAATDKFVNEVQNSALNRIENVRSQALEQLKS